MKKLIKSFLALGILCSLTFGLTACNKAGNEDTTERTEDVYEKFPEVSFDELLEAVTNKTATVIDANSIEVFNAGHVPTAISFFKNKAEILKQLPADLQAKIICYCGGPLCNAWQEVASLLDEAGYVNVYHFKEGINGWKESGGELVSETAAH